MRDIKITDELLRNIIDFEVESERSRLILEEKDKVKQIVRDIEIEGLLHISSIIGSNFTISEVRSVYLGRKLTVEHTQSQTENYYKILINIRRVGEYFNSLLDSQSFQFDLNFLGHVNKILLTGVMEEWEINLRGQEYEDTFKEIFPIKQENLKDWYKPINGLFDWYRDNAEIKHPLFVVSYVYYMLNLYKPWKHANALTSLMILEYLSKKLITDGYGILPAGVLVDEYKDEFVRVFDYVRVNPEEYPRWIDRYIRLSSTMLRKRRLEIGQMIVDNEKKKVKEDRFIDLNSRQLKVLRYLQNIPQLKREDYVQIMEVSSMTAYRDLSQLVDKGLLKKQGQGRATKYLLISS